MKVSDRVASAFLLGEDAAVSEVYLAYRKLLYFIIITIVKDEEEAKDVFQETFLRALEGRSRVRDPRNLEAYLTSTARHLAINRAKQRKPEASYEDIEELYGEEEKDNLYLQEMNPFLTDKESLVAIYRFEYGYSFADIRRLTGMPISSAKRHCKEAVRKIKKQWEKGDKA